MFLTTVSHPDIAYAVNIVSKYQNSYNRNHWEAVKRIFRYLIGTDEFGIEYGCNDDCKFELIGYSDSDFANDLETSRSTTGYFVYIMDLYYAMLC